MRHSNLRCVLSREKIGREGEGDPQIYEVTSIEQMKTLQTDTIMSKFFFNICQPRPDRPFRDFGAWKSVARLSATT